MKHSHTVATRGNNVTKGVWCANVRSALCGLKLPDAALMRIGLNIVRGMEKTAEDHVLAVVKAGINAVPFVGGVVASLISDYIPTATQRTVEKMLNDVGERLTALGDRIDANTVNKDEFAELFKSVYLVVMRTHNEAKLKGAANLIVNILLRLSDAEKLSYTELDHYARCLDQLSAGAIQVLAHAVALAEQREPGRLSERSVRINFENLQAKAAEASPSLLMGLVGELDACNFIHRVGVPSVRAPDYANYALEVTPLGARFVRRLLEIA